MAAKYGDRVKETTSTTGTGTLDLDGAVTGFRAFSDEFADGDARIAYLIVDDPENPTEYEYGWGTLTYGTPDTLSRDTVLGSSNSDNKVSWTAGTKTVIATPNSQDLLGVAAAVVRFDGTGAGPFTPAFDINVDDITDNSTGNYTVNLTDDMADANYAALASANGSNIASPGTYAVGSFRIIVVDDTGNVADASVVTAAAWGNP